MQKLNPKAVWLFFIIRMWGGLLSLGIIYIFIRQILTGDFFEIDIEKVKTYMLYLIGVVVIGEFIWAKLTVHFYRYELREDGFRKEHGIIWKKYVTIPYDRIQNVDIFRGFWARVLGLSDIQIQTAGGITAGSYGAFAEGRLPGVSKEEAEKIRDELIRRARTKNQGL